MGLLEAPSAEAMKAGVMSDAPVDWQGVVQARQAAV